MSLAPGTRIGPYEILAPIGAGGMGEVYRAKDTRLDRDVAIKILPEAFAADPERLARFEREAKTLAALNHPNIAQIYGLEALPEATGNTQPGRVSALVMELVEGENLAERIARGGALPLTDALAIATQIAAALEAAHEKGIVHRDLKPANIMLASDGEVKVLDFGLAKAGDASASSSADFMNSPTITSPATQVGTILGTAAYMSPEQAKGRAADRRSDVWSLGCVLYEMLAGRRAFEGEDLSDTLAAVLRGDPDWTALPAGLPDYVRDVVRQCLTKDQKARIPDPAVVRYLLRPSAIAATPGVPRTATRRVSHLAAAALGGAVIVAAAAWPVVMKTDEPRKPSRFRIEAPSMAPGGSLDLDGIVAISPDGRTIAFVELTGSATRLAVRHIDQLETRVLADTSGARTPFFSPDGKWIGFFTGIGGLRKVSVDGGAVSTIAALAVLPRGASWGDDDAIVFCTSVSQDGLKRVSASGGEIETIARPDVAKGEYVFGYPWSLPGGRRVLFQVRTGITGGAAESGEIAVVDLETGAIKRLMPGGQPSYLDTGHLAHAAGGSLRIVPFDLERLEVTGDALPLSERVEGNRNGAAGFSIAKNGTLLYVPGDLAADGADRSLVWVDRSGREEPAGAPARSYFALRLSPDGTRVALDIRDQETDIWVWDIARKGLQRMTFDAAADIFPVWSHDGRTLFFRSGRRGPHGLFRQPSNGTDTAEQLVDGPQSNTPTSVTPDGRGVVFTAINETEDIMLLTLDTPGATPTPLLQTRFRERNGAVSPNGKWIAYESDQSSEHQIYVRPFPSMDSGEWQVSLDGGRKPLWSRDGRELFYVAAGDHLVSTPIADGETFAAGQPRKLFPVVPVTNLSSGTFFDVMPDGRRFIMIKEARRTSTRPEDLRHLVIVLDWTAALK